MKRYNQNTLKNKNVHNLLHIFLTSYVGMYVEQVSEELHNNLRSNCTKIHEITYMLVKSHMHQISEN